jgi:hypothetical protein
MEMMRYFHSKYEVMINRLDRDEGKDFVPNEGLQHPHVVNGSVYRELEKVNFPKFFPSTNGLVIEAWLENMEMCFTLCVIL